MESLYLWLKFVHVAAVAVWVGGIFALTVLNARLARMGEPAAVAALGQQSEAFGRTVIGPAMIIVLIAGLWMAGQFGIPFTSLWIVWGLVGFVVSSSSAWSPWVAPVPSSVRWRALPALAIPAWPPCDSGSRS